MSTKSDIEFINSVVVPELNKNRLDIGKLKLGDNKTPYCKKTVIEKALRRSCDNLSESDVDVGGRNFYWLTSAGVPTMTIGNDNDDEIVLEFQDSGVNVSYASKPYDIEFEDVKKPKPVVEEVETVEKKRKPVVEEVETVEKKRKPVIEDVKKPKTTHASIETDAKPDMRKLRVALKKECITLAARPEKGTTNFALEGTSNDPSLIMQRNAIIVGVKKAMLNLGYKVSLLSPLAFSDGIFMYVFVVYVAKGVLFANVEIYNPTTKSTPTKAAENVSESDALKADAQALIKRLQAFIKTL